MSLKDVLDYAAQGWMVFPLLPNSKMPATPNGFHDASKVPEVIHHLWNNRTNLNLGVATGEVSGFWVLDIDAGKGGTESLEELENKYGSLPDTLISNTGGGGKHYFFKIPRDIKVGCTSNKIAKGIDTRGNGGYIVAPPSRHQNGRLYEWANNHDIADAPRWLLTIIANLRSVPEIKVAPTEPLETDWTAEDVLSMLDFIDPDDRDTWIKVGMSLHEGGWPVSMWDTWSRGSSKYKSGEPLKTWNGFKPGRGISFGSLVHMAQANGWEPKEKPHEPLDLSNVSGVDLTEFKRGLHSKPAPAPVQGKIQIGGIIGETVAWINSCSNKLQPELAAMHTIATLGAVFGRRYALQRLNTRTNVYMVAIAESGQGKDNSRNCLPKLLRASGLEQFSGPEDIRSGAGLLLELKKQPSFVANIDEFGMFMGALSDPRAAGYLKEISTIFTSIYGKSSGFYKGGITASQPDNRTVLNEPNLCIYGTTTLGSYAEAMRKSSINSGKLNRFIVFKTPIDFPEPNKNCCFSDPPDSLVSRWSQFAPSGWGAGAPDIIEQEKIIVKTDSVEGELEALQTHQDTMQREYHSTGLGPLWVRYRENVIKIAMIVAIARDCKNPKLTQNDLELGKQIVGSSLQFMIKFASDSMYDSDFEKKCSEFMNALEKGADTRTEMIRVMKIKSKEMDEIQRTLREMNKIDYNEKERPMRYYLK